MNDLLSLLIAEGLKATINHTFGNLIEVDLEDEVIQVWQTNAPHEKPKYEITDTRDTIKMVCRSVDSVLTHMVLWLEAVVS
ncbi:MULTISPECIES: hypothetical protein [unclassified Paenibacillus]|uniref:hypothetical protein n=1 Tax=unclassified Paenibacillus TaxID=185978 RepID=UPI000894839E|nr:MULTISPECIES: hypothetical protein [unclassified Paenibacillus]OMC68680.1 hypothetical protein BK126_12760 [Paenibacillus sp. FSL H7-0326]SDW55160.1 hypothetical protein SAMN05518848_102138 [Paenibacillus sp. PDC88]